MPCKRVADNLKRAVVYRCRHPLTTNDIREHCMAGAARLRQVAERYAAMDCPACRGKAFRDLLPFKAKPLLHNETGMNLNRLPEAEKARARVFRYWRSWLEECCKTPGWPTEEHLAAAEQVYTWLKWEISAGYWLNNEWNARRIQCMILKEIQDERNGKGIAARMAREQALLHERRTTPRVPKAKDRRVGRAKDPR